MLYPGYTDASSWGVITNNYFIKGPVAGQKLFVRAKPAFPSLSERQYD